MKIMVLSLFVLVLLLANVRSQTLYKWTDENGTVNFSEDPTTREFKGMVQKDGSKVIRPKASPGVQGKIPVGRSYYDAHPKERLIDEIGRTNKPVKTGDARGGEKRKDSSTPSGAIDVRTGKFYPGVPGGVIDPKTGQFMPDVGGGSIDPNTGRFIPKQ